VFFLVSIYFSETVKVSGVWCGHCCFLVCHGGVEFVGHCLISRVRVEDIDRVYTLRFD